jgi:hypothetical protein
MLATLALSLALSSAASGEVAPHGSQGMAYKTEPGGQVVEGPAEADETEGMPRYHEAPLSDDQWQRLAGRRVLVVLGTAGRECVTLTRADQAAVYYVHERNGAQQAPRRAVTAVHEHSWECGERHDAPPAEWARVGAGLGIAFSVAGLGLGVAYDLGRKGKTDPGDYTIKHFMYAGMGLTTTLFGPPIVAIGASSTGRDLRVRGKIWARALGYIFFGGAVVTSALWLAGQYGGKTELNFVGITSLAGGFGLVGTGFMAYDALSSRAELLRLHDYDAGIRPQARRGGLRFGAGPMGQGFALSLGGRF